MIKVISFFLLMAFFISPVTAADLQQQAVDTFIITQHQNDKKSKIENKKDAVIRIELEGSFGGSGYLWIDLTKANSLFSFDHAETIVADSSLIGLPEKRVFFYKLTGKKGKASFHFELKRPWDTKNPAAQTFKHCIKICKK